MLQGRDMRRPREPLGGRRGRGGRGAVVETGRRRETHRSPPSPRRGGYNGGLTRRSPPAPGRGAPGGGTPTPFPWFATSWRSGPMADENRLRGSSGGQEAALTAGDHAPSPSGAGL